MAGTRTSNDTHPSASEPTAAKRPWWTLVATEHEFYGRQLVRLLSTAFVGVAASVIVLGLFYNNLLNQLTGPTSPLFLVPEEAAKLTQMLPSLAQTVAVWSLTLAVVCGLTTTLAGMLMIAKLAGPLHRLKDATRRMGNGDLSVVVEIEDGDEFKDLIDGLNDTLARVQIMVMASQDNLKVVEELQKDRPEDPRLSAAAETLVDALRYFDTVRIPAARPGAGVGPVH